MLRNLVPCWDQPAQGTKSSNGTEKKTSGQPETMDSIPGWLDRDRDREATKTPNGGGDARREGWREGARAINGRLTTTHTTQPSAKEGVCTHSPLPRRTLDPAKPLSSPPYPTPPQLGSLPWGFPLLHGSPASKPPLLGAEND